MPAPARMQRMRHAAGAMLPADGAAPPPVTACTEGASDRAQMHTEPAAWCDPRHTEQTLTDRQPTSPMLSALPQASTVLPSARRLPSVPPAALPVPSQQRLLTGETAAAVHLGQAPLQQHLQPDHSLHTELGEAAIGSTQPLEQPTASTGTSRLDPQWLPGEQSPRIKCTPHRCETLALHAGQQLAPHA